MRVLLPLVHQNSGKEDELEITAAEAQGIEFNCTGDDFEVIIESNEQRIHQALPKVVQELPKEQEEDGKLPPKPCADHQQRKRVSFDETQTKRTKQARVTAKKPPPPSQSPSKQADLKMTAPKFYEEEERQEGEVLENEPPPVAAAASPQRNFVVAPAQQQHQQEDGDPELSSQRNGEYVQDLKKKGLEIAEQAGDGNCLFRAVSLQVYGDASMHAEVRARCMDFMAVNEEHFGEFVTGETFKEYIARKRTDGVHGNNPEIQAISELYNRPVEVYTPDRGGSPINIFHKEYGTSDIPIRLSYHDGNHYNAVIDPIRPTAGLGLGLPGLQPGLADKQQMATAVMESDQQMDLEKAIKESEQELSQAYDDELQRALKESSQSVAYVSVVLCDPYLVGNVKR